MVVNKSGIPQFSAGDLLVRCFAERIDGGWQAFSLEYGLAAQGDTLPEVRRKLQDMIATYLLDAVTVDREHAEQLLSRRASFEAYAKYYAYRLADRFHMATKKREVYQAPLPLQPAFG